MRLVSSLALSIAVIALIGCSSDDSSDKSGTGGSSGSGGKGGGGGTGAKAGGGGTGATTSGGGSGGSGATGGSAGSSSGGSAGAAGSGGAAGAPSCKLSGSGPIVASSDGQVIEKVLVTSTSGSAIEVNGHANVIIRDVEILHTGGPGIDFSNAPGLHIERVHVVHVGAPAKGQNPSDDRVNIVGYASSGVVISHVKLEQGSSGIYLVESPNATISFVEGHDFRGPFPRGQLVQFDKSPNATLEDFSCENPVESSWPEDNVSAYRSSNITVRRGLLSGNNSPSGVGVMFELSDGTSSGGLCEDVDTLDMGNGSFSGYPAKDIIFRRTRARDNHCGGQAGRDAPLSNSLVWAGSPESSNLSILESKYFNLCNPGNIVWDSNVFTKVETTSEDFTPRAAIREKFCWE